MSELLYGIERVLLRLMTLACRTIFFKLCYICKTAGGFMVLLRIFIFQCSILIINHSFKCLHKANSFSVECTSVVSTSVSNWYVFLTLAESATRNTKTD